jgi:hypothetical protein
MSFRSVAAKNVILRMIGVMTVAGAALVTLCVTNESFIHASRPRLRPSLRRRQRCAYPTNPRELTGLPGP